MFLRRAEEADRRLLHEWRNEKAVRLNSFMTDPIPYENHCKWFDKVMQDETVRIYILMDEDIPVGQIRINEESTENGTQGEISYSIDSDARGKGYGRRILFLCEEKERLLGKIKGLTGKVKYSNIASQKAFERNDFRKDCSDSEYIGYSKDF